MEGIRAHKNKIRRNRGKLILFTVFTACFAVSIYYLIANTLAGNSAVKSIDQLTRYEDENQWYWTCTDEALKCGFYFEGNNDTAPVFDPLVSDDNTKFTYNIVSRNYDYVGVLNSNGDATSFIFSDGEETMKEWNSQFSTYQFKPSGTSPSGIMHETFQGTSADYVYGKCVKVYVTSWQVQDSDGNTVENVNDGNDCIVFRTGIVENENEESSCEKEYEACDFMFSGQETVPTYTIHSDANDIGFTDVIVARDSSVTVGVMNSNGRNTSFILGSQDGGSGEIAMNDYISAFTQYQFKPDGVSSPRIMHETFQSETDARGKCVKVYFTEYQTLDSYGYVIDNVETTSASSCVVFQTASAGPV